MEQELCKAVDQTQTTGYLHPLYAASFAEFGIAYELPECGGWIIERNIPGSTDRDAMGCYPIFCCRDWNLLPRDVANLEGKLVSLALVTDPFGNFRLHDLMQYFDICIHFKDHYIADMSQPIDKIISKKHRINARRALRKLVVDACLDPHSYVDEWARLYACLIERHSIQGIRKFSKSVFESQLRVPGVVYFRVLFDDRLVGGQIYYLQNDVAYSHLTALTDEGYTLRASYAAQWAAMEYFAGKVSWLSLGGGAGLNHTGDDGLANFKRGWASGTRPVYFCAQILDRQKYTELARAAANPDSTYFPLYRAGEYA